MKKSLFIFVLLLFAVDLSADDIYVRVTTLSELDASATYLFVAKDHVARKLSNNVIITITTGIEFSESNNVLTVPTAYATSYLVFMKLVVLDAANHVYAIKIASSNKYLSNNSNTYLNQADNYSSKRAQWEVVQGTDGLNVRSCYNTNNYIRMKSGGDISCNSTSSYTKVVLFKKLPKSEKIVIGSSGYTTYVPKNNLDFSQNTVITPYVVIQQSATAAILQSLETVPAQNPIIVNGAPGTYSVPVSSSSVQVIDNLLIASNGSVQGDGKTIYALANLSDGVGFYLVNEGVTIPSGRCFLRISENDNPVRFMHMNMAKTTGIHEFDKQQEDIYYYTLSGQRVTRPSRGLYIHHGKKIVIR